MILVFNHSIREAITIAAGIRYDDDGYILAKVANILRRYLEHNDCWINFCVDRFSLEFIFAWIKFRGITFIKFTEEQNKTA